MEPRRILVITTDPSKVDDWKAAHHWYSKHEVVQASAPDHLLAYHDQYYVILDYPAAIHPAQLKTFTDRNIKLANG